MFVRSFEVEGLLNRDGVVSGVFHRDLNILTGRNGAGKTSILKLIWYTLSGNILLALKEVPFTKFYLECEDYEISIFRTGVMHCRIEYKDQSGKYSFTDDESDDGLETPFNTSAEEKANAFVLKFGSSLMFPTFRRIEGGFGTNTYRSNRPASVSRGLGVQGGSRQKSDIEIALDGLSGRLSQGKHMFVSSISTSDIVSLLLNRYTELSEEFNQIQKTTSESVIARIKEFKSENIENIGNNEINQMSIANQLLDTIKNEIEALDGRRVSVMSPIKAIDSLIGQIFKTNGISFGPRLRFGDAANAVSSDVLSAGEKQMLSFVSYNAFNQRSCIVIDEPELSLHVDWQRQIFPILMGQQSSNQFIIATHSPFIYSKYPDKEVNIDPVRGDEIAED